ncbi:hypothetical protein [Chelatococcus sp. XZ-Ab1]|uniref:hypothetical protein n=1 Tax=Chelatococcus sp. XZ-Ab1 TaxID=3034027 RepID=UPI0023E40510|nr:hypothetical protein [Chelatococcus sp. XZ-Ab1]
MDGLLGGVTAGEAEYTTPGTYQFQVPLYNSLRRRVWGAGGSGSATWSGSSYHGANGGASSCGSVSAGGGQGGRRYDSGYGAGGAGGVGTTENGGAGTAGWAYTGGHGGYAPHGGAGTPGTSGQGVWSQPGGYPGGGSGGVVGFGQAAGGGGGGGGYSDVSVTPSTPGAPVPGEILTVVVGAGGAPVTDGWEQSGRGGDGRVLITWS